MCLFGVDQALTKQVHCGGFHHRFLAHGGRYAIKALRRGQEGAPKDLPESGGVAGLGGRRQLLFFGTWPPVGLVAAAGAAGVGSSATGPPTGSDRSIAAGEIHTRLEP